MSEISRIRKRLDELNVSLIEYEKYLQTVEPFGTEDPAVKGFDSKFDNFLLERKEVEDISLRIQNLLSKREYKDPVTGAPRYGPVAISKIQKLCEDQESLTEMLPKIDKLAKEIQIKLLQHKSCTALSDCNICPVIDESNAELEPTLDAEEMEKRKVEEELAKAAETARQQKLALRARKEAKIKEASSQ